MTKKEYKLRELIDYLKSSCSTPVELVLNNINIDQIITGIATLRNASKNDLSFYTNTQYRDDLLNTHSSVVITAKKHSELVSSAACLITENPHVIYTKIAQLFDLSNISSNKIREHGIHNTAVIGENCHIAEDVYIGPYVVIGDSVSISKGSIIKAGVVIGDNCSIGENSILYPKVVLYNSVSIGAHCIVHSGAIIGSDGFGFAFTDEKTWLKVPQLGGVKIGDNVEIGANTTIDRGAIEDTCIAQGVKLDNQIQIAHNVTIDKHTIIAAQVGIAGSSKIGKYCAFGGGSAISGHVSVANGVKLAGFSTVGKSIDEPGFYASGTGPVLPYTKWRRLTLHFENLDKYASTLKKISKNTDEHCDN